LMNIVVIHDHRDTGDPSGQTVPVREAEH
jgi:hypothetical protein